jgi:hypothetical protein
MMVNELPRVSYIKQVKMEETKKEHETASITVLSLLPMSRTYWSGLAVHIACMISRERAVDMCLAGLARASSPFKVEVLCKLMCKLI